MNFENKDDLLTMGRDSPELSNDFDCEFASVNENESELITPLSANKIKVGGLLVIDNKPCKLTQVECMKVGKHGHSKYTVTGTDILTGKKYEDCFPSSQVKFEPIITHKNYVLMNIDDEGYLSLIDNSGNVLSHLRLPDKDLDFKITEDDISISDEIRKLFNEGESLLITILSTMGSEKVVDYKKNL